MANLQPGIDPLFGQYLMLTISSALIQCWGSVLDIDPAMSECYPSFECRLHCNPSTLLSARAIYMILCRLQIIIV